MTILSRVKLGEFEKDLDPVTAKILEREFKAPILRTFIQGGVSGEAKFEIDLNRVIADFAYYEKRQGVVGDATILAKEAGIPAEPLPASLVDEAAAYIKEHTAKPNVTPTGTPLDLFLGFYR